MTVEYGSAFYFIYPITEILIVIGLYFLLRHRSQRVKFWVIFAFLAFNFALHFCKLFFYPYNEYTDAQKIRTISPENICAANVMLFPFLYLSKKPVLRDYMFFVGIISGFAAIWLPSMGDFDTSQALSFDALRFYTCHGILWMMPLLMVVLGVHKLNYHRIWQTPIIYYIVITIVLANEVCLKEIGVSTRYRNNGFIFYPPDDMAELGIGKFVLAFVPSWFKPTAEHDYYWPIAWQIFPVMIIGCPLGFVMSLRWEGKHFISDIKSVYSAIRLWCYAFRFGRKKIRYRKKYGGERWYRQIVKYFRRLKR
ncbi:MAG: hypothetical protein LUI60_04725 [Clostridia bacterium]|nr:hypothetical protein [Clostridia bacterium]